ncbi:MAG: protein-export chaperone SecB [Cloacibacterium sp.]|nr:protein-export chaperone SecB [Cloacibacterium sp.]
MMESKKSKIQFERFLVRENHIVFRNITDYKISIDFEARGLIRKKETQFFLHLLANVKDEDDNFDISILTESLFSYDSEANVDELINSLFTVNAPAIVFPYIRAYISSLTALSGMPVLTIPTLNLTKLGAKLKENITIEE